MSETTTDPTSTEPAPDPVNETTPGSMAELARTSYDALSTEAKDAFDLWHAEQAPKHIHASLTLQITWLGMAQPTAPEGWTGKGYLVRAQNGRPIASIESWTGLCKFLKESFEADWK